MTTAAKPVLAPGLVPEAERRRPLRDRL